MAVEITDVLVNGQFIDTLSVYDRGLAYGDGLFATLLTREGRPCLWASHYGRLSAGCLRLRISVPDSSLLLQEITLLLERMQQTGGLVLHVIARFHETLDWDDLESLKSRRPMDAFNRTKLCNRVIAGELARRYAGRISSVAFDPTFVLDKSDPEL